ncbi:MAG: hypothetical protein ABI432_17840 [Flavobacteriales bacterium]
MNLATPALHDLASRLLQRESEAGNEAHTTPVLRVCGKFGVVLTRLAGAAGFRSLLSRALALAQAEVPWLTTVTVLPDGTLEGFSSGKPGSDADEATKGGVILVAQLLGLLLVFVGESLTLQLVKQIWPEVSTSSAVPNKAHKP